MSPRRSQSTGPLRQVVTVAAALAAVALLVAGGTVLQPQSAPIAITQAPLVGRTTTVCTTTPDKDATATLSAIAVRKAPGREGTLTATELGSDSPLITVEKQGFGEQKDAPEKPALLTGEGVMATAGSGVGGSRASKGEESGLMAAPCTAPATGPWGRAAPV